MYQLTGNGCMQTGEIAERRKLDRDREIGEVFTYLGGIGDRRGRYTTWHFLFI
jgi:hypothetical protein